MKPAKPNKYRNKYVYACPDCCQVYSSLIGVCPACKFDSVVRFDSQKEFSVWKELRGYYCNHQPVLCNPEIYGKKSIATMSRQVKFVLYPKVLTKPTPVIGGLPVSEKPVVVHKELVYVADIVLKMRESGEMIIIEVKARSRNGKFFMTREARKKLKLMRKLYGLEVHLV